VQRRPSWTRESDSGWFVVGHSETIANKDHVKRHCRKLFLPRPEDVQMLTGGTGNARAYGIFAESSNVISISTVFPSSGFTGAGAPELVLYRPSEDPVGGGPDCPS